jgi:hypothetical protein
MQWLNQVAQGIKQLVDRAEDNDPTKLVRETSLVQPRVGIEGTVIVACVCGAPGVWKRKDDPNWQHVPGVLLPLSDERVGRWVGMTCPNCDRRRAPPEKPVVLMQGKPGWLLFGR